MNFGSFLPDFCAAIASGVALAFLFFLVREWWHPLPNLIGHWYFETEVVSTTKSDFSAMHLKFEATIWQAGPSIKGLTEKIFEQNSLEAFEYDNDKRTHGELEGYVDRFYLRKNRIVLHLNEHGRRRDSSSVFELRWDRGNMIGTFDSTAAGITGKVVWSRQKDSPHFSEIVRDQRPVPRKPDSPPVQPPLTSST